MQKIIETNRLILRPFTMEDASDVFEFNSNPVVTKYTGEPPITSLEEAIGIIRKVWYSDYENFGYGRFAVVYKPDNKVIGFSGLKYCQDLNGTDLGYRFLPEYWGKGIATESCLPCLQWGFEELNLKEILGLAYPENVASCHILSKVGMKLFKKEPYPGEEKVCHWYRINKTEYMSDS